MGKTDVNISEIRKITNISINEVSGNFSPEWLSCSFIESVINESTKMIEQWNSAKKDAEVYISEIEKIGNQPEPLIPRSNRNGGNGGSRSNSTSSDDYRVTSISSTIKSAVLGTKCQILEYEDGSDWVKVRLEDGTEGYILIQCIQMEEDKINGIIIETTIIYPFNPTSIDNSNLVSTVNNESTTISSTSKSNDELTEIIKKRLSDEGGKYTL